MLSYSWLNILYYATSIQVHESPDLVTVEEKKVSIDTAAKSMQKISISSLFYIKESCLSYIHICVYF